MSGLSGESSDIIAIDNPDGRFYVEVSPQDVALSTNCVLVGLDDLPASGGFLTELPPGTYLVGRDIQPGIYSGETGPKESDFCFWRRLSGLSGESYDNIAIDSPKGRFYVEVSAEDLALSTTCELTGIGDVLASESSRTQLPPGTYLVGSDIKPGIYSGQTGTKASDSCSWKRLSGFSGEFSDVIAIDRVWGRFYVEISAEDFAFSTTCEMVRLDGATAPRAFPTQLPAGTYLVGRDIQPGVYSGQPDVKVSDSCSWERLSGLSGEFSDIIAIDVVEARFYVQVFDTDFAVKFGCPVSLEE